MAKKSEIDIEEFYLRYSPMVFRRCRYLLRDEDSAQDAMHEVFVRLLEYQNRLKDAYPSSLLYTIATNVCLNIIRDQKRHKRVEGNDILEQIAQSDLLRERFENREFLNFLFSKEKQTTREIAVMHYVDKMTLNEISRRTGLSHSGVRKRLRKLKDNVKAFREDAL
ncbi:MAG: sigma-70 family RNA polymerase sigma factor [Spirochaetota bacterium]|nr:sigma-70 family RNA polymerase sigma factor [Spirochaetota bacterium]